MTVEVRAPLTGTVWRIVVRVGDRVDEEQAVAVLESMKMEIPVGAPAPGRVAEVHVAEGDAVEEGALLVTLE